MMDINMEIEKKTPQKVVMEKHTTVGVAAFKEGDDDRIYLDDFDTFLERCEVYYIYQAIPPIQADGGREVYGKDYANTNDIPDAMISSEFIENRNNELGGEQRDKSSPDEIQRVGGDAEVEKSVGRGGKKVNKKKILKKHDPTIGEGKFQCDVCMIYMPQKHCIKRHKNLIHKISK